MIQISTINGCRTYEVPQVLINVAMDLFAAADPASAIFQLARRLVSDDLHTTEQIAIHNSHKEAVDFARRRLVRRTTHQS